MGLIHASTRVARDTTLRLLASAVLVALAFAFPGCALQRRWSEEIISGHQDASPGTYCAWRVRADSENMYCVTGPVTIPEGQVSGLFFESNATIDYKADDLEFLRGTIHFEAPMSNPHSWSVPFEGRLGHTITTVFQLPPNQWLTDLLFFRTGANTRGLRDSRRAPGEVTR
jgi:hypothetical protein